MVFSIIARKERKKNEKKEITWLLSTLTFMKMSTVHVLMFNSVWFFVPHFFNLHCQKSWWLLAPTGGNLLVQRLLSLNQQSSTSVTDSLIAVSKVCGNRRTCYSIAELLPTIKLRIRSRSSFAQLCNPGSRLPRDNCCIKTPLRDR